MVRMIAIVEDDAKEAQILQAYFNHLPPEFQDTFQVHLFQTARSLLSTYQPIYDIVFMDINLPDLNGLEAAGYMRRLDQNVVLIFVTSMAQYAVRGYEVDALDFLLKPVSFATFTLKLKRALSKCASTRSQELLVTVSDGVLRTSAARIKYVEVSDHALIYHTTDGTIRSYGNLKQVEAQLDPRQFVRCNRCYLVNLAFVRGIRGSSVILDGAELQISRPKRNTFLTALNNYLGGEI